MNDKHLLRLGIGAKELNLEKEYCKSGRINYMLGERIRILEIIGKIQTSLNIHFTEAFTCELAEIFYRINIKPLIAKQNSTFPFNAFVEQNPELFEDLTTPEE